MIFENKAAKPLDFGHLQNLNLWKICMYTVN